MSTTKMQFGAIISLDKIFNDTRKLRIIIKFEAQSNPDPKSSDTNLVA